MLDYEKQTQHHPDGLAFDYGLAWLPALSSRHQSLHLVPAAQMVKERHARVSQTSILRMEMVPVLHSSGPYLGRILQGHLKFKAILQSYLCFHGTSKAISSFVLRKSYSSDRT